MNKYLIIADDFTGSNDTGVQMKKRKIETEVVLFPESLNKVEGSMVLDTESRNIPKADSYIKVLNLTKTVFEKGNFDIVFKKVDSTVRGNIKEEVKAVQELYSADKIIFAPAFPKIGRTTADGIHYLKGVRILETEMAKDPYNPVTEDNISEILRDVAGKVTHHELSEVRSGNIDLSAGISHTFDAEETSDLEIIARSCNIPGKKILWVGSAGLADALFDSIVPQIPSLAVVGSISEVAEKQMAYAAYEGVPIVLVPAEVLLNKKGFETYVDEIVRHLSEGRNAILTSSKQRSDYNYTIEAAKKLGLTGKKASNKVQEALGILTKDILSKVFVSGLFLTGGDTAISVINHLGSSGSRIKRELSTGVVLSELQGGLNAGLPVVTKAGAFGEPDTIFRSLTKLKEPV